VTALGERGEPDEVREQDADEPPLRARADPGGRAGLPGLHRWTRRALVPRARPALAAELRCRGKAGTTDAAGARERRPALRAEASARVVRRATVVTGQA